MRTLGLAWQKMSREQFANWNHPDWPVHIEDQEFPNVADILQENRWLSFRDGGKDRSRGGSRRDKDSFDHCSQPIHARSKISRGLNARQSYLEAGADAIFPEALKSAGTSGILPGK